MVNGRFGEGLPRGSLGIGILLFFSGGTGGGLETEP